MKITTDMTTEEIIASLMEASREGWPVPMEEGTRILLDRFARLEALAALVPKLVGAITKILKQFKAFHDDEDSYGHLGDAVMDSLTAVTRARELMQAGTEEKQ